MSESEERPPQPNDGGDQPGERPAQSGEHSAQPDDPNLRRPRRRGRRGRGAGAPPGQPFRPQGAPFPGRPQGGGFRPQGFRPQGAPYQGRPPGGGFRPQGFRPQGYRPQVQPSRPPAPGSQPSLPHRDGGDEDSQAREIGAYERREQQRQQRGQGWRPPSSGGWRGGAGGGAARPRYGAGPGYADAVRRATGGPRTSAPSHEAGEPIAGPHAVLEAIRAGRGVRKLYISQDRGTRTGPVNDLIAEAQQRGIFVNFIDKLDIARLSPIEGHQGVVAIVEERPGVELDELLLHLDTVSDPPLVLLVDSLQDPQNFGVLLRSAEGAGVDGVVVPRHRSVGITAAVARTSAGASEHLLVADVANLRQAIDAIKEKGIWVVGADESGDLLYDEVDYRGPSAIVIGGEAEGIRRLVLEGCDQVVRIPMEGRVSSLNAAAAGTVILYEALRQRRRDAAPPATRTPRPEPVAAESREAASEEDVTFDEAAEAEEIANADEGDDAEEVGPAAAATESATAKPARKKPAARGTTARRKKPE